MNRKESNGSGSNQEPKPGSKPSNSQRKLTSSRGDNSQQSAANIPTDSHQKDNVGTGIIKEELDSPTTNSKNRGSIMSIQSQMSKADNLNDMLVLVDDLKLLIKDDEWYNIPAPIRTTCEGIIAFQQRVTETIIFNAESSHRKVISLQDKQRKVEYQTQTLFSQADSKVDNLGKRQKDSLDKVRAELKREIVSNAEAISRLQNHVQSMQGTLEVWDGKIRRVDQKMHYLQDLSLQMDSSAEKQKKYFDDFQAQMKDMIEIPGLMGEPGATYATISDFVKKIHSYKSESLERLDMKVHQEKIRTDAALKKLEKEMLEYMKIQEREVQNLGKKTHVLEEQIDEVVKTLQEDDDDEENDEERGDEEDREDDDDELNADNDRMIEDTDNDNDEEAQDPSEGLMQEESSKPATSADFEPPSTGEARSAYNPMQESAVGKVVGGVMGDVSSAAQTAVKEVMSSAKERRSPSQKSSTKGARMKSKMSERDLSTPVGQEDGPVIQIDQIDKKLKDIQETDEQKKEQVEPILTLPAKQVLTKKESARSVMRKESSKSVINDAAANAGVAASRVGSPDKQEANVMSRKPSAMNVADKKQPLKTTVERVSEQRSSIQEPDKSPNASTVMRSGENSPTKVGVKKVGKSKRDVLSKTTNRESTFNGMLDFNKTANTTGAKKSAMRKGVEKKTSKLGLALSMKKSKQSAMYLPQVNLEFERRVDNLITHQAKFESETAEQIDSLKTMLAAFSASIWLQNKQIATRTDKLYISEGSSDRQPAPKRQPDGAAEAGRGRGRGRGGRGPMAFSNEKKVSSAGTSPHPSLAAKNKDLHKKNETAGKAQLTNQKIEEESSSSSSSGSQSSSSGPATSSLTSKRTSQAKNSDVKQTRQTENSVSNSSQSSRSLSEKPSAATKKKAAAKGRKGKSPAKSPAKRGAGAGARGKANATVKKVKGIPVGQDIVKEQPYGEDHEQTLDLREQVSASQMKHLLERAEDQAMMYTKDVAQKYHFIEAYLKEYKETEGSFQRYNVQRHNSSVKRLLTANWSQSQANAGGNLGSNHEGMPAMHHTAISFLNVPDNESHISQVHHGINLNESVCSRGSTDGKTIASKVRTLTKNGQLTSTNVAAMDTIEPRQQTADSAMRQLNKTANGELDTKSVSLTHKTNILVSQVNSSRNSKANLGMDYLDVANAKGHQSRAMSAASSRRQLDVNDCPKCRGESEKRPCMEWVDTLREEFTLYVDGLFRVKMKEFVEFVEDYIEVEDQIDPDQDNVIHAFYRKHNTLQKTNENFRLLEYKRKKYMEKKKQTVRKSRSPDSTIGEHDANQTPPPQRNFLTSLYHSTDLKNIVKQATDPELKTAFHRFAEKADPIVGNAMYRSIQVEPNTRVSQGSVITAMTQRNGSARQSSLQTQHFGDMTIRQNQHIKNLTMNPTIDLAVQSTGTTQKRLRIVSNTHRFDVQSANRYQEPKKQQTVKQVKQHFPIISTRKAHLTVDQRVWEAQQPYQTQKQTEQLVFPNELQNVPTLKHHLIANSSEMFQQMGNGGMSVPGTKQKIMLGVVHGENVQMYPPQSIMASGTIPPKIMNQDSSCSMQSPAIVADFATAKNGKQKKGQPLTVQFQELVPGKKQL